MLELFKGLSAYLNEFWDFWWSRPRWGCCTREYQSRSVLLWLILTIRLSSTYLLSGGDGDGGDHAHGNGGDHDHGDVGDNISLISINIRNPRYANHYPDFIFHWSNFCPGVHRATHWPNCQWVKTKQKITTKILGIRFLKTKQNINKL